MRLGLHASTTLDTRFQIIYPLAATSLQHAVVHYKRKHTNNIKPRDLHENLGERDVGGVHELCGIAFLAALVGGFCGRYFQKRNSYVRGALFFGLLHVFKFVEITG